jgi:ABC-type phosphate/phosphonate transport system substrate-binding protein
MPALNPSARRTATAVAVALLALGAGSCGNSSDESEDEPAKPAAGALPTPTKQQYIAATAKICARADERIGAFIPLGTDPTTRRSSRQAIIEIIREQVDEMRAVGYPPGARAKVESIYRAVEQTLDRAEKDESASIEDGIDEAVARYSETAQEYTPGCGGG